MSINIATVKEFIRENIKTTRFLADVAERFHVSTETLRKDFSRQERVAFSNYLTRLRIDVMKEKLVQTNLRCFEIAFEAGFQREDTAAKSFKRETGVSMEQYRKHHNNGKGKNGSKQTGS